MVGGNNPRYFIPRLQAKVANPLLLLIRAGGGGLGGCFRLNRRGRVPRPPTLVAPFWGATRGAGEGTATLGL